MGAEESSSRSFYYQRVALEGMVLKPNMVVPGKKPKQRASVEQVADMTARVLCACVPVVVPGIAFLSGGQSDEEATAHLDAINRIGGLPLEGDVLLWPCASRAAPQKAWSGKSDNVATAQRAFLHRARMNGLAPRAANGVRPGKEGRLRLRLQCVPDVRHAPGSPGEAAIVQMDPGAELLATRLVDRAGARRRHR